MPLAAWKYIVRDLKRDSAQAADLANVIRRALELAEARIEVPTVTATM